MSLTRAEWEELWQSIKRVEQELHVSGALSPRARLVIKPHVKLMKDKIQQVIGQME